jgi:hypothetical protein
VQKPIEAREINFSEYRKLFKSFLSSTAEFYAKKSSSNKKGLLIGAFRNGEPCGVLSAGSIEVEVHSLFHFETAEPYRKQGVCRALLAFILPYLKSSGTCVVETGVEFSSPFYGPLDFLLKKNGFQETKTLTTVINSYNDDAVAEFYDFKKKRWDKIEARLIARGYAAKSFAESGERELQMLKDEMGISFPENLSPFRHSASVLKDVSFVVFKDDCPAAYCVMTGLENVPGVSVVSSRASSSKIGHSGTAMWALIRCMEESILYGRFRKTIFTFESDNCEMANLKNGPPTRFKGSRSSVSQIYRLYL